jgi:hypothetical protein
MGTSQDRFQLLLDRRLPFRPNGRGCRGALRDLISLPPGWPAEASGAWPPRRPPQLRQGWRACGVTQNGIFCRVYVL